MCVCVRVETKSKQNNQSKNKHKKLANKYGTERLRLMLMRLDIATMTTKRGETEKE